VVARDASSRVAFGQGKIKGEAVWCAAWKGEAIRTFYRLDPGGK
jgi:hypothetical protein